MKFVFTINIWDILALSYIIFLGVLIYIANKK